MCDHDPGLLTSTMPAIVRPRKTSSETRRCGWFVMRRFRNWRTLIHHSPLEKWRRHIYNLIFRTLVEFLRTADRLELERNLNVRTLAIHIGPHCACRNPALFHEQSQNLLSSHPRLNCLNLCQAIRDQLAFT